MELGTWHHLNGIQSTTIPNPSSRTVFAETEIETETETAGITTVTNKMMTKPRWMIDIVDVARYTHFYSNFSSNIANHLTSVRCQVL